VGAPFHGFVQDGLWTAFIGWFIFERRAGKAFAQVAIRENPSPALSAADVMSKEVPTVPGHITLEEYSAEVPSYRPPLPSRGLATIASWGMMNVHTLNSMPRGEWTHNSVQAAMIPRDKILWTSPDEPLLKLLERLLSADVNQMPVVSGASDGAPQIVGIVTRDSILRVMARRAPNSAPLRPASRWLHFSRQFFFSL